MMQLLATNEDNFKIEVIFDKIITIQFDMKL